MRVCVCVCLPLAALRTQEAREDVTMDHAEKEEGKREEAEESRYQPALIYIP